MGRPRVARISQPFTSPMPTVTIFFGLMFLPPLPLLRPRKRSASLPWPPNSRNGPV
jgi:hypothetical protein